MPACEPKVHSSDSQSGHMPGLWAKSLVGGAQETTTHRCFSPSFSPSLPLSLKIKINRIFLKIGYLLHSQNLLPTWESGGVPGVPRGPGMDLNETVPSGRLGGSRQALTAGALQTGFFVFVCSGQVSSIKGFRIFIQ